MAESSSGRISTLTPLPDPSSSAIVAGELSSGCKNPSSTFLVATSSFSSSSSSSSKLSLSTSSMAELSIYSNRNPRVRDCAACSLRDSRSVPACVEMAPKRSQRKKATPATREAPRDETAQLLRLLIERVTRLEGERQTPAPASSSGHTGAVGDAITPTNVYADVAPTTNLGTVPPASTPVIPTVATPAVPAVVITDTLTFKRLKPPTYSGDRDYFQITEWISQMEKHFEYAGVSEGQKVLLAAYQLTEDAYTWWLQFRTLPSSSTLTWVQFKGALMGNFLSSVERDQLVEKFLTLQQHGRSVAEYAREFSRLSLLASGFVPDEEQRISRFMKGLRYDFQQLVVAHRATTYAETVEAALRVEAIERDQAAKKAQHGTSIAAAADFKRKGAPSQEQGTRSQEVCTFCHKVGHSAQVCRSRLKKQKKDVAALPPQVTPASTATVCTYCKRPGHQLKDCRRKQRACFKCGQVGHLMLDCPMKEGPITAQPLRAIPGAQDKGKAVLNVITQGEALVSTDVISGFVTAPPAP